MKLTPQEIDILKDLGKELLENETMEESIQLIAAASKDLIDCDRVSIFLHDEPNAQLWTVYADKIQRIYIDDRTGIAGHVLRTGQTYWSNNVSQDPLFYHEISEKAHYQVDSIAAVPIFNSRSECIGVLQTINPPGTGFKQEDVETVEFIAGFLSSFLEIYQLEKQFFSN